MEKTNIRSIIAYNVKKYRKVNNMTQEALAEAADISNTYIANIECGQTWVSDKTLEKIAKALHTDYYLFFISENAGISILDEQAIQIEMISYISKREKELNSYIKCFFSDTVSQLLKICHK